MKDKEALARAVLACGGRVVGDVKRGRQSNIDGFAFDIFGTYGRAILDANGTLTFAGDYSSEVQRIRERYAIEVARKAAESQGWVCQDEGADLIIYHPEGGTLRVTPAGTVDASGFLGGGCIDAAAPIEQALGQAISVERKAEFYAERAKVREGGE